ncbi:MAG TPA: DnaJ C-terminal domain-containing protein [Gammaproteobacteria bacterium]|nr:DnaJ C-terminal domain-containing protein [Gammaproteobacteria bacterium]
MQYKDYYKILGVAKDATQDEIKRAYRKLARKYHPDVSQEADAEARFKEVNEANEVLKDPGRRAAYDQLGSQWRGGQDFTPPPDWDTGFEFRAEGMGERDFSDFFESLFGGRSPFGAQAGFTSGQRRRGFQRQGEDHRARIRISLEDSFQGARRTIQLQAPQVDAQGHVSVSPHALTVRIPKGIIEGQQIRLAGQGGAGQAGGQAGDLYLDVEFEPHPRFRPEGRDLHQDLPVTPWEAALGDKVKVPTLGGPVELRIPAGARSGQRLRLAGRGLPGTPPGDQYVTLQIITPPARTAADKDFYRRMAKHFDFDPRQ